MSETLNELTDKYQRLASMVLDEEVDDEAIQTTLDDLNDAIEEKADAYAVVIDKAKEELKHAEEKSKKWNEQKIMLKNRIKRLKDNLQYSMEQTGKTKFKTDDWSFSIRKSKAVDVVDEQLIPAMFIETKETIKKKEIKDALKDGIEVPGAILKENESILIK